MLGGPDLILSCNKETNMVAVLSLQGPAAGMGSWVWWVTLSENTGQSNSLKISYVGAQKTSTKIIACDERDLSEVRSTQLDE